MSAGQNVCEIGFLLVQTIAGIAVALKQAAQPEWRAYAKQVIANARAVAKVLTGHGYKLQTDGTDNHLVLWGESCTK